MKLGDPEFETKEEYLRRREELKIERVEREMKRLEDLVEFAKNRTRILANDCTNVSATYDEYFGQNSTRKINNLDSIKFLQTPRGKRKLETLCTDKTYLFIFVVSHFENFAKRKDARKSWALVSTLNTTIKMRSVVLPEIRVVFVLGRAPSPEQNAIVAQEQKLHGDILQINTNETYENLVYKTLIGLRYARDFCSNAKYVMKVDDDILINLPLITSLLHHMDMIGSAEKVIGHCYFTAHVVRMGWLPQNLTSSSKIDHTNSWKVPCDVYPFQFYPDYTSGHGYIITARLAWDMYTQAEYTPLVYVEDAFVSGILRQKSIFNSTLVCRDSFSTAEIPRPHSKSFPVTSHTYAVNAGKTRELWSYFLAYVPKPQSKGNSSRTLPAKKNSYSVKLKP